jgi:hypothetical protein
MVMVLMALALAGCGGGGAKVKTDQSTYTTTLGKELQDLEEAHKRGLLTEKQYEDAKKKLIEQRTKTK